MTFGGDAAGDGRWNADARRLTRVRGVPLTSEALGFSKLGGVHQACSSVAISDGGPRLDRVRPTVHLRASPPSGRRGLWTGDPVMERGI